MESFAFDNSTAQAGTAVVVLGNDGWEAFPFGLDGGSSGIYPTSRASHRQR